MTQVGTNYGGALYLLAKEEGLAEQLYGELSCLLESFEEEPSFCALLKNPALPKAERCQILEDSFRDRIHPYVLNFLRLLTEKGYVGHFSHCCQAYTDAYYEDAGLLPVQAFTAVALSPQQTARLKESLGRITGKQILLTNPIDPSVLGGVRLDYQGMRLDDTVAHRLATLRDALMKTVL